MESCEHCGGSGQVVVDITPEGLDYEDCPVCSEARVKFMLMNPGEETQDLGFPVEGELMPNPCAEVPVSSKLCRERSRG